MKSRKKLLAILMAAVMALTSITVALAVTTADNVKTEGFEMPDKALLQAFLDDGADANGDGILTVAEMEDVTRLSAQWLEDEGREKIQNLSGIEVAKKLRFLDLLNHAIEDITPLETLTNLEYVDLKGNPVENNADALHSLFDALTEDVTIHVMQGQTIALNDYIISINTSPYIIKVETSSSNEIIFDTTHQMPTGVILLTGKKAGEYRVTVTFPSLVKEMTVVVHAPEESVTEISNNIPELRNGVGLQYADNTFISAYRTEFTALYPSGELYYINEAQEIQLSDRAKEYGYVYAGNDVYHPNQVNILEQDGSLWNWRWEKGAAQPEKTRVAENIVQISGAASVDTTGTLWIEDTRLKNVTDVIDLTKNAQCILKSDGTVWKNAYDYYKNPHEFKEGHYEQIDQDVKALIDLDDSVINPMHNDFSYFALYANSFYIKNDNTTWVYRQDHAEKMAGFNITDIAIGEYGNLFVVDETGAVWRIAQDDPSDCTKVGENFCDWSYNYRNNFYPMLRGFRAQDGRCYDINGDEIEDNLHPDGSQWYNYSFFPIEPFQLLSSVENYLGCPGMELRLLPSFIMTRSDGSIWGYRFNEASMDYPVMIKEPIGAESYTLGDVNLDGKVNTTDARLALRGAAKLEALTPQQILAADVNKNGKADTSDARKILRGAAKLDQF